MTEYLSEEHWMSSSIVKIYKIKYILELKIRDERKVYAYKIDFRERKLNRS